MAVTQTLSQHIVETRRLLHDATGTYWTDETLTSCINRAIRQRDRESGMNRVVVQVPLVVGQSFYDLNLVDANATDLFSIILRQANTRVNLIQMEYTAVTSFFQSTTVLSQTPAAFARIGATQVYIAPIPNIAYVTEWDVQRTAPPLVAQGDVDPLPEPWTDPVPFLAASFARLMMQQVDEARLWESIYKERLMNILSTSRTRMIVEPYSYMGQGMLP